MQYERGEMTELLTLLVLLAVPASVLVAVRILNTRDERRSAQVTDR